MACIELLLHIMDKPVVRTLRRRREHSAEFTRELVAGSLQPVVSVAAIAMEGGINANLLFGWRKHLDGMAQADAPSPRQPQTVLLPVSIEEAPTERSCPPSAPPMRPGGGAIEIGSARFVFVVQSTRRACVPC